MANAFAKPAKSPQITDHITSTTRKFTTWVDSTTEGPSNSSLLQRVSGGDRIR